MSMVFLTLAVILNAGVIKEDFLVNSDLPYESGKTSASAAATSNGWYVVWQDTRNAAGRSDIYGQALTASLAPSGANRMVPSDPAHLGTIVAAASDSSGKTIVLWKQSVGNQDYYWLRRLSLTGELLDKDTFLFGLTRPMLGSASLAMNSKGEFAMTWHDSGRVELRVFNPDGSQKGEPKIVVEDSSEISPRVSIAENGATIVTWSGDWADLSPEGGKIYARCYKPNGEPRGDVFEVAAFENNPAQPPTVIDVAVGCDHAGIFIISWIVQDWFSTSLFTLYYRCFGWDGTANEPAQKILDIAPSEDYNQIYGPYMAVGWDGTFSVAWSDSRSGQYRVYLQNFYADGSTRGPEMVLSEQRPEVCEIQSLVRHEDQWFAVYLVSGNSVSQVRGRKGNVYGALMGQEVLISDDQSSCSETMPQVIADDSANFVILWSQNTGYGRRFSKNGTPLGDIFQITDSSGVNRLGSRGNARAVMNRRNGEFALVWSISSPYEVRAQRFNKYGSRQGSELKVAELSSSFTKSNACMNRKGTFAVVWTQSPDKAYVKRFDKDNKPIDANSVQIGTPDVAKVNISVTPAITLMDDGSFLVAWRDQRGGIWTQGFNASAKPLAEEFRALDSALSPASPALAVDSEGNYCISCESDVFVGLFIRFFDAQGNPLTDTLRTGIYDTNQILWTLRGSTICALPEEGFVFCGTDCTDPSASTDVSAVFYRSDGTRWSKKMVINQPDEFSYNYHLAYYNSAAVAGDRIFYAWQDNRRHMGWDIYAKIMDLDVPGGEEAPSPLPLNLEVVSAVGPAVTLKYSDWPEGFRASVFDASGRKVDEIYTPNQSGVLVWGPRENNTGVYFIVPRRIKGEPAKVVILR